MVDIWLVVVFFLPILVALGHEMLPINWGSANVAAWVQAVGSILAIVAAGAFPIWHSTVAQRKREEQLLHLMRVLAEESCQALWLLSNSFVAPEHEGPRMRQYIQYQRGHEWEALLARVAQIPVAEIPPEKAADLGVLRDAVSFGAYVASLLPDWVREGSSALGVVMVLRAKRDHLGLVRMRLPVPPRVPVEGMVDAQARGFQHEQSLEPLNIDEAKVYRRPHWHGVKKGDVPQKAQVQIVFPFSSGHPLTFDVWPSAGVWETIYQQNDDVLKKAREVIDSIKAI